MSTYFPKEGASGSSWMLTGRRSGAWLRKWHAS